MPSRCSAGSGIASPCCSRPTAAGPCAAGVRSSPRGWSRRRARRRAGSSLRPCRSPGAACPSSAWSLPASSPCATSSSPCCRGPSPSWWPRGRCWSRNSWPARRPPGAYLPPSPSGRARCCCTATAIRRRSGPWGRWRRRWRWCRASALQPSSSSCCGMAGAFGYGADTYEASVAMGELSLLPAVRAAEPATTIVANGFSCRHQIRDGTGRKALARDTCPAQRDVGSGGRCGARRLNSARCWPSKIMFRQRNSGAAVLLGEGGMTTQAPESRARAGSSSRRSTSPAGCSSSHLRCWA